MLVVVVVTAIEVSIGNPSNYGNGSNSGSLGCTGKRRDGGNTGAIDSSN